jgi:hypothetical protein
LLPESLTPIGVSFRRERTVSDFACTGFLLFASGVAGDGNALPLTGLQGAEVFPEDIHDLVGFLRSLNRSDRLRAQFQ